MTQEEKEANESIQRAFSEAVRDSAWDRVMVEAVRGADLQDIRSPGTGRSAIHRAIAVGRTDIVDALIHLGADPNFKASDAHGNRQTPLHIAVLNNNLDAIELLLARGASINVQDQNGDSPLALASEFGKSEIVRRLLLAGADPNAMNMRGSTSLHAAVRASHFEIVKQLLDRGADPTAENKDGFTPLGFAKRNNLQTIATILNAAIPKRNQPIERNM